MSSDSRRRKINSISWWVHNLLCCVFLAFPTAGYLEEVVYDIINRGVARPLGFYVVCLAFFGPLNALFTTIYFGVSSQPFESDFGANDVAPRNQYPGIILAFVCLFSARLLWRWSRTKNENSVGGSESQRH